MYHSVARVYIAQSASKHQRRGRPRPWSLELFCFVFWGSRHWLKNNFAAFMHSFHTNLYKEQRFDTKKRQKIWSQPNFLEVTWPQINFVQLAVNELIFMVRSVTLGGDCDVCYCRHRQRNDSGFLTIASKYIYDHVTAIKKSGCDHIFCRFSLSNCCSLYRWACNECINAAKWFISQWREPHKAKQKSSKLQGRGRRRLWCLETFCAM